MACTTHGTAGDSHCWPMPAPSRARRSTPSRLRGAHAVPCRRAHRRLTRRRRDRGDAGRPAVRAVSGCTSSPARAAPARPRSAAAWPWPWPASGRRILLCEVEGRQGIAQLFDVAAAALRRSARIAVGARRRRGASRWPWSPRPRCWSTSSSSTTWAGPARCSSGSARSTSPPRSPPGCATCCSPARSTRRYAGATGGRPIYDAVVLDAPPTGRIGRFLNVNEEVADLAKVGPIRNQADSIMSAAAVAADRRPPGHPARGDAGPGDPGRRGRAAPGPDLPVGAVVVNMVRDADTAGREQLAAAARGTGCDREMVRRARGGRPGRPGRRRRRGDAQAGEAGRRAQARRRTTTRWRGAAARRRS